MSKAKGRSPATGHLGLVEQKVVRILGKSQKGVTLTELTKKLVESGVAKPDAQRAVLKSFDAGKIRLDVDLGVHLAGRKRA